MFSTSVRHLFIFMLVHTYSTTLLSHVCFPRLFTQKYRQHHKCLTVLYISEVKAVYYVYFIFCMCFSSGVSPEPMVSDRSDCKIYTKYGLVIIRPRRTSWQDMIRRANSKVSPKNRPCCLDLYLTQKGSPVLSSCTDQRWKKVALFMLPVIKPHYTKSLNHLFTHGGRL